MATSSKVAPGASVEQPGGPSAGSPRVSVVVPFRDASVELPGLVAALGAQRGVALSDVEVVAVDNASADDGTAVVRAALAEAGLDGPVLARDDVASSYAARNTGVAAARGAVLAFTDADCRPAPTWLAALLAHLEDPAHARDVVAGAVDLALVDPTNVWELYDHAVHLDNESMAASGRVATANMAVRREVFREVGAFAELTSGADHLWSRRAIDRGCRVVFVDTVRVAHPTRRTRAALVAKMVRTSRGQGEAAARDPSLRVGNAVRALARPLRFGRHLQVARTPEAVGGPGLRVRLFGAAVELRIRQIPAFVAGWRAVRDD